MGYPYQSSVQKPDPPVQPSTAGGERSKECVSKCDGAIVGTVLPLRVDIYSM